MRAQVSIEYLLITGFSLALIAPLLVLFASQSDHVQTQFQQSQAQQAAQAIADSAQRVYYAGPPSKETFSVRVPERTELFTITNTSVVFTLRNPSTDIIASTNAQLVPAQLNPRHGHAKITVQATNTGVVVSDS